MAIGNPLIIGRSVIITTALGVALLRGDINTVQAVAIALVVGSWG